MRRLKALKLATILLCAFMAMRPCDAAAQAFPNRTLRLVTIFAPGSASDIHARFLAQRLSPLLGQPVIVENKPGGGGLVATRDVLRSQPYGYSLLYSTPEVAINPFAFRDPQYRLDDLAVAGPLGLGAYSLLASAALPVRSVAELLAHARANKGRLNYGSLGPTSGATILAERLKYAASLDMEGIPFKGGDAMALALTAGDIHLYFATLASGLQRMKQPQIRALAVTSAGRMKAAPDLPTLKEGGVDLQFTYWSAVFMPAATPRPIQVRLQEAMSMVTSSAEAKDLLGRQAIETWSGTVEQFAAFVRRDAAEYQADYQRLKIPLMD